MLLMAGACCRRRLGSAARQALTSAVPRNRRDFSSESKQSASEDGNPAVIFSGIQPTGIPHLGNYLGAMRQWKRLQDKAGDKDKLIFCIVDLHAITMPQDAAGLRNRRRELLAALMAIGLNPKKSTLFYQSSVYQHSELMWILSCTASMGYLTRMTQYKTKLLADNQGGDLDKAIASRLKLGLFSYPVLQAADILVHRATHVPVGDDQRQHLEFARECVTNFNHACGRKVLVSPATITAPSSRIMSLQHPYRKMSKSSSNARSRILITAEPQEIQKRFASAVTDQINKVTYEPLDRPGVANLLEIAAQFGPEGTTPEQVAADLDGLPLSELKDLCTRSVTAELSGVHERYLDLLSRRGGKYLDDIEAEGAEVARNNAEETMRLVRSTIGLGPLI
ncbi:tryptophanyl-tRNA synthetase [Xylaria sp. CBS 124048]|nr:tryptophanyl-tRNA synthetase [Xylaria sp. CBS 124048]